MTDSAKVVFIDRDGVINEFPGQGKYVTGPGEFRLLPGSAQAIRKLNEHGFRVFVISNQQGLAKGLYSQRDLDAITRKMINELKKKKAVVDGVYYCTHLSQDNCLCRKPKTGLLEQACSDFRIRPGSGFLVGDSMIDVETALAMKIKSVLVLSGREKISGRDSWPHQPDFIFDNLLLAAHYICAHAK